jgi:predicted nucleic acid-binding protein
MILVDTSVWVTSLRREASREREELALLLALDEAATTDLVVAEVLQGARTEADFQELSTKLDAPHYYHAGESVWLQAARLSFDLKRRGLTTPLSDLVIASVALANDLTVYATDSDFARVPGLRLHALRS